MCGRFASAADTGDLVAEFEVQAEHVSSSPAVTFRPGYNVAPTDVARVVLTRTPRPATPKGPAADPSAPEPEPIRQMRLLRWGLVPSWAKDASVGVRLINARFETMFDKPAFRAAAASRRCVVPVDGWYEWQGRPAGTPRSAPRQPYFMRRVDGASVALAGLYEFWRDPAVASASAGHDPWVVTFTIVTTEAEPALSGIHGRQPLVVDPEYVADWLDPAVRSEADVADLVRAVRPGRFAAHRVSAAVGRTVADGPHLVTPVVDGAELQEAAPTAPDEPGR